MWNSNFNWMLCRVIFRFLMLYKPNLLLMLRKQINIQLYYFPGTYFLFWFGIWCLPFAKTGELHSHVCFCFWLGHFKILVDNTFWILDLSSIFLLPCKIFLWLCLLYDLYLVEKALLLLCFCIRGLFVCTYKCLIAFKFLLS